MARLTRRELVTRALPVVGAGAVLLGAPHLLSGSAAAAGSHASHDRSAGGHADFRDGRTVDHEANGFDPSEVLRDFDAVATRRQEAITLPAAIAASSPAA